MYVYIATHREGGSERGWKDARAQIKYVNKMLKVGEFDNNHWYSLYYSCSYSFSVSLELLSTEKFLKIM